MPPVSAPTPLSDRCGDLLGEMRAELAARGARKSPRSMLLAALVRLLETLLRMVAAFAAGRLGPVAAAGGAVRGARGSVRPAGEGIFTAENAENAEAECNSIDLAQSARPARRQRWVPAFAGMTRQSKAGHKDLVKPAQAGGRFSDTLDDTQRVSVPARSIADGGARSRRGHAPHGDRIMPRRTRFGGTRIRAGPLWPDRFRKSGLCAGGDARLYLYGIATTRECRQGGCAGCVVRSRHWVPAFAGMTREWNRDASEWNDA